MELFVNFDFKILDDPDYKEDAVREDIVTPILKKLGYQPSGQNRIVRSKSLTHPFVYIGTKQHKVNIIPDYLLMVDNKYVLTIDAKSPNENIRKGPNLQQAFSYAIHPEIRTSVYGLCNGREICIFTWTELEPILSIRINEIDNRWKELYNCISPIALTKPHLLDFLPDFGLYWYKSGADRNTVFDFASIFVNQIAKLNDNTYSLSSVINQEGDSFLVTFDFKKELYKKFLECVPKRIKEKIIRSLTQQPFNIQLDKLDRFNLTIIAEFGELIHSNDNEKYFPLKVIDFEAMIDVKQIIDDIISSV